MQHNTKSLIEKPKACKPLDSNTLNVILNNGCQVHLKPLKMTNSDAKIYYRFFSSIFPHSWPCFSHFAQPEAFLKFLPPILTSVLQHRFKVLQQKFFFPKCIWLLYATQFYSSDPFFLHHPSTSTPHIYPYFEIYYYFAKSLAQQN
jgi:hypothetical protein